MKSYCRFGKNKRNAFWGETKELLRNQNMGKQQIRVLWIGDDSENPGSIRQKLKEAAGDQLQLTVADCSSINKEHPAGSENSAILIEMDWIDNHGLDTLARFQAAAPDLPILVLAEPDDGAPGEETPRGCLLEVLHTDEISGESCFHAIQKTVQRKEIEQAYAKSEQRFRTMIEKNADGIIITGEDNRVLYLNPSAESLFSRKAGEIIGKALLPAVSGDSTEINIVQAGRPGKTAEMRAAETEWGGRPASIISIRDISDRKQAEQTLKQTVKALKAANRKLLGQQHSVLEKERFEALLQMAGTTANELSQPLMVLQGTIDLMHGKAETAPKDLERIDEAGRRIADIVQKMRTLRQDIVLPHPGDRSIIKSAQPVTIVAVEDDERDFARLQQHIKAAGNIHLVHAGTIKKALEILESGPVDIIFTGYILPDGTGIDLMGMLRQRQLEIPVVVATGVGDEIIASQCIQAGAYEYLPKPRMTGKAVARVINNTMEKFRAHRKLKRMERQLARMATQDKLTGLYNRRYFEDRLQKEINRANRYHRMLALAMFDLDHFKNINDRYGHPAGDHVLREVGRRLRQTIRQCDIACRYGGEEFIVIMPETDLEDSRVICERIRDQVQKLRLEFDGKRFNITISGGTALYDPSIAPGAEELIKAADRRLYHAKKSGRNRVVLPKAGQLNDLNGNGDTITQ